MEADIFAAVADPTRRKLLELLLHGERSIASLCGHFTVTRTSIVKHLQVLQEAGLVVLHKSGRESRFSLRADALKEVAEWLNRFQPFWAQTVESLEAYLKEKQGDGQ